MASEQIREFFREKSEKSHPVNINWGAKRDEWISAVERLYARIQEYLQDAGGNVQIARSAEKKKMAEPNIGAYEIDELVLRVGDETVVFSPKGCVTVGSAGRVDVVGDRGQASLVLQSPDQWSLVVSRTPALRLIPLTSDSLLEVLKSVMRP